MSQTARSKIPVLLFSAVVVLMLIIVGYYYVSADEGLVTAEESAPGPVLEDPGTTAPEEVVPEAGQSSGASIIPEQSVEKERDNSQLPVPFAQAPPTPESVTTGEKLDEGGPFADSPALRSQETIKVDPSMREIGQSWIKDEGRNNFSMPVSGGRDLDIEVERFEAIGKNSGEFIGTVKDRPGSSVRLSYRGQAEAGTIRIPSENRIYRIFPGQDGSIIIQDRDLATDEQSEAPPAFDTVVPPVPNFIPPPPPDQLVQEVQDNSRDSSSN